MPMKPHKGESQSDFMARCMSETFTGDREQEQAVAICMNYWRSEHGGEKPKSSEAEVKRICKLWCHILNSKQAIPDPEESRADFIARCVDEMVAGGADEADAEDACDLAWEERSVKTNGVVQKTHSAEVHGLE